MQIFVSSGAFFGIRSLDQLIPVCQSHQILNIELASGLRADDNLVKTLKLNHNINFLLHNYFPAPSKPFVLNLADLNSENRNRSIVFVQNALKACSACNVPFYSVHAGFVASLVPDDLGRPERQKFKITKSQHEKSLTYFTESIIRLSQIAKSLNVKLLIENNVHAVPDSGLSHLLLSTNDDICNFFEQISSDSVGFLLDVAHLKVSSNYLEFDPYTAIECLAPWISALHLSDNDGFRDTNELCTPDSWFWSPINQNCNKSVIPILESYRLHPEQIKNQIDLINSSLHLPSI